MPRGSHGGHRLQGLTWVCTYFPILSGLPGTGVHTAVPTEVYTGLRHTPRLACPHAEMRHPPGVPPEPTGSAPPPAPGPTAHSLMHAYMPLPHILMGPPQHIPKASSHPMLPSPRPVSLTSPFGVRTANSTQARPLSCRPARPNFLLPVWPAGQPTGPPRLLGHNLEASTGY